MVGLRILLLLPVLGGLGFLLYSWSGEAVPTFGPGGAICFERFDANDYHPDIAVRVPNECDGDPSPNVSSDTVVKFCAGWNDDCTALDTPVTDSDFGGVTGFLAASTVIKPGGDYPAGALAGQLSIDASQGILGNNCILTFNLNFTLMNASLNIADTIAPKPIGQKDVMLPLAQDANGNRLPDGADKYPRYLRALFDVDHNFGPDHIANTGDDVNGPSPPLQPIVRMFGATRALNQWAVLNLLVFQPGSTVRGPDRSPAQLDPQLGYPTAIVLQDPTVPLAPGRTSDSCAPTRTRYTSFGLTRDNPCTGGQDTPTNESNCPSEMNAVGEGPIQNAGTPFLPCENINSVDEDGDTKINDGCPQINAVAESGAECDDDLSGEAGGEDSNINDGCPAVAEGENVYLGAGCTATNEGACAARQNPSQSGSFAAVTYTRSLRDADGDGIENELDVCSLKANPEWNPRAIDLANDNDFDGLPNVCDPNPNQISPNSPGGCEAGTVGPDEDQDCYSNRQDNCPLAIGLQNPSIPPHPTANLPRLFDGDGDGIGDLCDITTCPFSDPAYAIPDCQLFGVSTNGTSSDGIGTQDGDFATDCLKFTVAVGVGADPRASGPLHNNDPGCAFFVATPSPTASPTPGPPPCNASADFDCDGVYTSAESACGSDPLDNTRRPERVDGAFHGVDDDGDTLVDEWLPPSNGEYDCDGDGYTGAVENYLYSPNLQGDQDPCGTNNFPPTEPPSPAGWPSDLKGGGSPTSTNRLDLVDLATFVVPVRHINTNLGTNPGDVRWDMSPAPSAGTDINLVDLAALIAGPSGSPPMLGGERAIGKQCPWPP